MDPKNYIVRSPNVKINQKPKIPNQIRKTDQTRLPSADRHRLSGNNQQTLQHCPNCKQLQTQLDDSQQQFQAVSKGKIDILIASDWLNYLQTLKNHFHGDLQCQPGQNKNRKIICIKEIYSAENIDEKMRAEIKELQNLVISNCPKQNIREHLDQCNLLEQIDKYNSDLQEQLKKLIFTKRQNILELKQLKILSETLKSLSNELPKPETPGDPGNPEKPSIIRIGGFQIQQFLYNMHMVYGQYLNDPNIKALLYKAETRLVQNLFEDKMHQLPKVNLSDHQYCPRCSNLLDQNEKLVYLPCHIYHESCFIKEAKQQFNQKQQYLRCYADQNIINLSILLSLEDQQAGNIICQQYFKVNQ